MAQFSEWYAMEILDHVLRGDTAPSPTNLWFGLATADTNLRANSFTDEVSTSGTGYARIEVGPGSAYGFSVAVSPGISSVVGQVDFSAATTDWGVITHGFLADASTAGNVILYGELVPNQDVYTTDIIRFLNGAMDVTL